VKEINTPSAAKFVWWRIFGEFVLYKDQRFDNEFERTFFDWWKKNARKINLSPTRQKLNL